MTEQKLPQPGEYWLSRGGTIRYVICDLLESCPERQDVYPLLSIGKHGDSQDVTSHDEYGFEWENTDPSNRDLVTRLPNCDSFDWTPSPAIDPGEGWELLPKRVILQKEDQCLGVDGNWRNTVYAGEEGSDLNTYRRRKPAEWPKYYIRTSGADSWVYRADGRYTIRNLTCNCVADPAEWYWRHGNMVEVTESEALARVTKPEKITADTDSNMSVMEMAQAFDKIATLVAPVESPDDWIEFERNLVPTPRYGIDEVKCDTGSWCPAMRAWTVEGWKKSDAWKIRCRRRDLPAAAPKRIPVRLWIDQADGEVIVTTGDDYATCDAVELLHDADGFYVTEGEQ